MVHILEESYAELKLELAMIIDVGTDFVKLCYQQEGDGFLAPTAYSRWQSVMSRLSNIADETVPIVERFLYLPIVDAMLRELLPTAADREERMKQLLKMTYPLHKKMVYDTKNRMGPTIDQLRAARVLSFEFVANTPLNALGEEVEQLSRIPSCIRIMQKLRDELELYREYAKIEMSKPVLIRKDLWTFWTFDALTLPIFFCCS